MIRRVAAIAAVACATLSAAVLLWELRHILLLFLAAGVTGAAIRPLVAGCVTRGAPRRAALGLTYLGIAVVLVVVLAVIGGALLDELGRVAERMALGYPGVVTRWGQGGAMSRALAAALPAPEAIARTLGALQPADLAQGALVATAVVLRGVAASVVVLALSAYWIAHRKTMERLALSLVSARRRSHVRALTEDIEDGVGRLVLAETIGALLAVTGLALGFHALALPYPTIPAVCAGLARLVPVAGPVFAAAIAVAATLAPGGSALVALGAAILTVGWLRLVDRVILRRLLAIRPVNPLIAVITVVVLTSIGGWWAVPLSSPMSLVVQIGIERITRRRRVERAEQTPRPDEVGLLLARCRQLELRADRCGDPGSMAPHLRALLGRLSHLVMALDGITRESVPAEVARPDHRAA